VTSGGGPAEPGGTPRVPESGTPGSRRRDERGKPADEIVDLGDIRRTEEILAALAASTPGSRDARHAGTDEPVVAALAALAADVRAGAGSPGHEDPVRDEPFRRRLHAACGRGAAHNRPAAPGEGRPGGTAGASRLAGLKSAVTAAAAAAAVVASGVAAAGLHGRLPGMAGAAGRKPVSAAQAPRTAGTRLGRTSPAAGESSTREGAAEPAKIYGARPSME
jgi:hypothetical protein